MTTAADTIEEFARQDYKYGFVTPIESETIPKGLSEEIVRLCVETGGALSGEHGIGLEKRDFMPLVFTPEDLSAQACVRSSFDPEGVMNPQKVLPSGARCGDFAMARGSDAATAAAELPDGAWI